jgi:flagellar hook-associated protein 3 FlgL
MRVTEFQVFQNSINNANQARERMNRATEVASSGLRVHRPWDDPAAAGQITSYRSSQDQYNSISKIAEFAQDQIQASDIALSEVEDVLQQLRTVAVQMVNDHHSADERSNAILNVQHARESIVNSLNRKVGDQFIFSGNLEGTPAFDEIGTFQGDVGERKAEIGPGVFQRVNIHAVNYVTAAVGGTDLFTVLNDLEAALGANDPILIGDTLDGFDAVLSQVGTGRAESGGIQNIFVAAADATEILADNDRVTVGRLADADLILASTNLSMAQTALNAALTATSRSFELNLLDKLR